MLLLDSALIPAQILSLQHHHCRIEELLGILGVLSTGLRHGIEELNCTVRPSQQITDDRRISDSDRDVG